MHDGKQCTWPGSSTEQTASPLAESKQRAEADRLPCNLIEALVANGRDADGANTCQLRETIVHSLVNKQMDSIHRDMSSSSVEDGDERLEPSYPFIYILPIHRDRSLR